MKIELFYTSGCEKCAEARDDLRAAAEEVFPGITWRELNAIEELDYAVEIGVVALPAIAMSAFVLWTQHV